MSKHPKRKRGLPRNIVERPDAEIVERPYGKRVKRELDKLANNPEVIAMKDA